MTEYLIDVHHLSKSFNGKPAVRDVSLKVAAGEIFGFLGPNGGGKTTTIRMLCGLLTPDSGDGTCLGYDIRSGSPMMKYLVGYVPQMFGLYQDLTVEENLKFIARVYEIKDIDQHVRENMEEFGLVPYAKILAGGLSGGWKQRLSLAAAVIHNPKLLLLDEPTAGVDPKARRDFWSFISGMTAKGISSLVSTHYMDEAERCNRLAYIVAGRLIAEGTMKQIVDDSHLLTYEARAEQVANLVNELKETAGIEQVVAWGNEVRICGIDDAELQAAMKKFPDLNWHKIPTGLEDVFIHFLSTRTAEAKNE